MTDPQSRKANVVVIGAGIVGAAAALALSRRGVSTALIEREAGDAALGSSKGGARIFAPAAFPDESYLEMGMRAVERWRQIEAESSTQLLVDTGALTVGDFATKAGETLLAAGERVELLAAEDVRRHFGVETEGRGAVYQPDAGVIRAEDAHAAVLVLAVRAGAQLERGEQVIAIEPTAFGAVVTTPRLRYRCETVVVAAGPWSRDLLVDIGIELEATVTAQTVVHLDVRPAGKPPVALMDFDGDEPYALWDPDHGLKVALHVPGLDGGDASRPPAADTAVAAELERWAASTYPGVAGEPAGVEACFYTRTPGERFVIARHGAVVVASACNGQGFQFAPETGERVARIAVGEREGSLA